MEDLVQFIVENQDYVWYICAFFVFLYFVRFLIKLFSAIFIGWRNNRIKI